MSMTTKYTITSGDTASVHKLFGILQKKKIDPLMVLLDISDWWGEMEIDTSAAVSLISHTVFDRHWQGPDKLKLTHMAHILVTYTEENITPCGTYEFTITYDNQQYHLSLVIVPGLGPTQWGRNWLEVIQLSWNRIHRIRAVKATPAVKVIIQR